MSPDDPFHPPMRTAPADPPPGAGAWQFEYAGPFSVGSVLSRGWEVFKRQYWVLVGVSAVMVAIWMAAWVISVVVSLIPICGALLTWPLSLLVLAPIQVGLSYLGVRAARGEGVRLDEMFDAFRRYWPVVGVNLLVSLIYVAVAAPLGCIMFMGFAGIGGAAQNQTVPPELMAALAVACMVLLLVALLYLQARLSFAVLACMDPVVNTDVTGAIAYSWRITSSRWPSLILILVLVGLIGLGSVLLLGIGYVLLGMPLGLTIIGAAYAALVGPAAAGAHCMRCGYDLTGTPGSVCPECGWGGAVPDADPLLGM